MDFPPLATSGPLTGTMESLLAPPGHGPLLILGAGKLIRALVLKGYTVDSAVTSGRVYAGVILMDRLPRKESEALALLIRLAALLAPGAPLFVIEQSSPITGRRGLVARTLSLLGFFHPPERLNRLFLKAGFTGISQRWPQGLRSLVVTWGVLHPLAPRLHQILSSPAK